MGWPGGQGAPLVSKAREPVAPLGEVQLIPTGDLRPYPANARRITQRAVDLTAESLRTFGWQQPCVADPQLVLVVGHVRHRAAQQLGQLVVPTIVAKGLSPAQLKAYRLADNRTHDYTTWDYGQLAGELAAPGMDDFAKVLDLANWQQLITEFEAARVDGQQFLTDQRTRDQLTADLTLTVTFADRAAADRAGALILDQIPGVIYVRYGYQQAGPAAASGDQQREAGADPAQHHPPAAPPDGGHS